MINTTTHITLNITTRILIAGGGTGGHIYPAIAIANAIKELAPDTQFLFVGAKGKMEMDKVPQAGYNIKGITIAGFNRSNLFKNIGLPYKLIVSFFQVKKILKHYKPHAVIGVGGYSTLPVLKYAQLLGVPTFVHESNSLPGKANIIIGKQAKAVFVAYNNMQKYFGNAKLINSGNPVRASIVNNTITRREAATFFGLNADAAIVLSVGGSLGATSINKAVLEGITALQQAGVQLIWQTGLGFFTTAKQATDDKIGVVALAFIQQMEQAYAAADVVISRAGAMAIAELATLAKPSILVPYPYAAENHQYINASYLVQQNAAILIPDSEVGTQLINTTINLLNNKSEQQKLSNNLSKQATKQAAYTVANYILDYLHTNNNTH